MKRSWIIGVIGLSLCFLPTGAKAQVKRLFRDAVGGGGVNLPYIQPDGAGSQWMVYQMGWLQQQGTNPVYNQGALLMVNGNPIQTQNNRARMDEKTGELLLDDVNIAGVFVSRRVFFNKEEQNVVRLTDVFRNATAAEVKLNIGLQSNTNYGITVGQTISDPKKRDQQIGWVGQTGNGRCVMEMYSGKGSKLAPTVNYQQGNNMVDAQMQLVIPPNKSVALVHFHGVTNSIDQATKWINDLREAKVLASLPVAIRKIVVNFGSNANFIGDIEVLRGDMQDLVELRSGDQLKGTLKDSVLKLKADFGEIELPVTGVLGLMNVGQYRARQLVVTNDGQVFGGTLVKTTIDLQLSSGQITQIPLSQVSRVGMRKAASEPDEIVGSGPFLQLRSGDRVSVQAPAAPISVMTRYGSLSLAPNSISAVQFQADDHGVHDIYLTDGSKFAGLVVADNFEFTLVTGGKVVRFPTNSLFRLQLQNLSDEIETPATLRLINGDLLVGTLEGQMKLDTAFDAISINGPELRALAHPKDSANDVQVTLWDQTTLTGQLETDVLRCKLTSGPIISVPPAMIDAYSQPFPRPSESVVEKIKTIVQDLNADDWKQRDRAEAELTQMGIAVIGVLKDLRAAQSPESQQRIDSILKQLQKTKTKP